jgi:hypothetical protein
MKANPRKLIKDLNTKDRSYKDKLDILYQLVKYPNGCHVIPNELIYWCKKVGLKPELNCDCEISWWTCSL